MADRISEIKARLERANATSESNDTWYLLAELDKREKRIADLRAALAKTMSLITRDIPLAALEADDRAAKEES